MLRRTARRLTQAYDQALRPSGLRLTQYSVLANLTRRGGLSITDLAELLAMERTTLTRNLRPLERAGWVRVGPGPDRRSRAVEITPAGRRVFDQALPLWREAERAFRRRLGRDRAAALSRMLDAALTSAPTPPT
jgi:DNA-binding MarR family transcriptional regulator